MIPQPQDDNEHRRALRGAFISALLGVVLFVGLGSVMIAAACSSTPERPEVAISEAPAQDGPETPQEPQDPRQVILNNMVAYLKVQAPVRFSITATIGPIQPGLWGYCELVEPHALAIWISDACDTSMMIEVMIHEWAHAVAWLHGGLSPAHGPQWGVAYSEVYLAVVRARWVQRNLPETDGARMPVLWCRDE
jgi:hypothetical protein